MKHPANTTTGTLTQAERRKLAGAVRDACLREALAAYEQAGISGLCGAGAWECAVSALRHLDIDAVLQELDAV